MVGAHTPSRSDELRAYPKDMLSSPLEVTSVTAQVAPGRGPTSRRRSPRGKVLQAPDRIADAGFASLVGRSHLSLLVILASLARRALLGRRARALARPRQDDHHRLPRRPARHAPPRRSARADRDGHAHDRRLRPRPGDARALAVHRPRPALPLAEPRLGPARRRHRRLGAARALAAQPASPPPSPPPRRARAPSFRSLLAVGVSGGLLPCPSALVVLLAAISLHRVAFGLLLILAFSAGLALTITGIGLAAVLARRRVPPRVASKAGWFGSCQPPAHSSSSRRGSP